MTYAFIPNPADNLSVSQNDIKTNFTVANTSFGINHVPFNVATNTGKHTICEMLNITPPGVPVNLASGEGTLYTLTGATGSNLYYTDDDSGLQYQLSTVVDANIASFGKYINYPTPVANQNGGWTFLPGGLLLQYGQMIEIGQTTTIVKFPIPFTTLYTVNVTRRQTNTGTSCGYITESTTGFTETNNGSSNQPFSWIAIGLK